MIALLATAAATLLVLYILAYFLLPEILLHFLGIGSWKRQYSPGVTLTFDDGPDPEYTPVILDILAQHDIKACFFLITEKAQRYPEIVARIRQEGHTIGSHGFKHHHSWLMTPSSTWQFWDKSVSELEKVTGISTEIIRPPWGGFNLALYLWSRINHKKIVVWNVKGVDWKAIRSAEQITQRILRKTTEGAIILLHDSGGEPGAPGNTISALQLLCTRIRQDLKLPIVPLAFPQWSLRRRIAFRLWEKWERFYAKYFKISRIDDRNLFRLCVSRYRGPDLYNDQGELLATKGDSVGEIHFDNIRFQAVGPNLQTVGIRALKQVRLSLPNLVRYIRTHPDYDNVKVYIGVTMINKGAKGLGFNIQEYPLSNGRLIGLLQKILLRIYHPAGHQRRTDSLGSKPKLVWISKEKLIEKYDREIPAHEQEIS